MAVVATAGCTATGAFDDLNAVADLCDEFADERGPLWLHVDAAHGGGALLSPTHRHRLDGLARAQSLAWDPHKTLLLPLAAGMLLVKDERVLETAFSSRRHTCSRRPVTREGGTWTALVPVLTPV